MAIAALPLDDQEKKYILEHINETDVDIGRALNRSKTTIRLFRQKAGFKNNTNISKDPISPNQSYTEEERKGFFKKQLVNSLFYSTLKQQFTADEIGYYLEEWGVLCVQFEDIVATEKRQIDELIKAEVMGNRILRNIRITEDEITRLIAEIEQFRKDNPKIEDDEKLQERDSQLMMLTRTLGAQSQAMSQDYQKNVDTKNKLLEHLNSRRVDRLDQIQKGSTTFIGLVEKLQNRDLREKEGRHMELLRLAKEKKKDEWRKVIQFPSGEKDTILLDDESQDIEQDMVPTQEEKYITKYTRGGGYKILILESDIKKAIYLSKRFKNNELEIVKSPDEAMEKIKALDFSLICLGEISLPFVKFITDKDLCRGADFIIHAEMDDNINNITSLLDQKRNIEKHPFNSLIKNATTA